MIVGAFKQARSFQINDDVVFSAYKAYHQLLEHTHNDVFSKVLIQLTNVSFSEQRIMALPFGSLLHLLKLESSHFDLSTQKFCAIRYCKPLLNLPPMCNGCGAPSCLDDFLICQRGGLVIQQYVYTRRSGVLLVTWRH